MTAPTDASAPAAPTPLEAAVAEYEAAAKAMRDRLGVPPPLPADSNNPTAEEYEAMRAWVRAVDNAVSGYLSPVYAITGTVRQARLRVVRESR